MNPLLVHQRIYEGTGGRVGHRMIGVPCLLLYTTGRKSGEQRCSALVYAKDADGYVLVASNGGSDRPPGWLFNIKADPACTVQVKTAKSPATARIVESGDADYPRLWALVNANNKSRYDGYQSKTNRPIPLVVVTAGPAAAG
jgi:F420H(2)-dependent quinone reductase